MTRPAFIDRLSPEQQKQLQAMREANAATMAADTPVTTNATMAADPAIVAINADLKVVNQDFLEAENARATATRNLGATASKADVDDMTAEIRERKVLRD